MERILAILNREQTAASVLHVAQLIAARLGEARISALHTRLAQDPSFMPTEEVMTEERSRAFNRASGERAVHLREAYETWKGGLANPGNARWTEVIGDASKAIAAEATQADLIVIGHAMPDDQEDARQALRAALYEAGAPVVIAPLRAPSTVGAHTAVAWKRSDAVDQAVSAALPILLSADQVTILMAQDGHEGSGAEPDPLLRVLEQGHVRCRVVRFDVRGREIGDALLTQAKTEAADLLVMGAYTHSQFIEMLLGGATREILAKADIPLLMHH